MQAVDVFRGFEGNCFLPAGSTGASVPIYHCTRLHIPENLNIAAMGISEEAVYYSRKTLHNGIHCFASLVCRLIGKLNACALQCQIIRPTFFDTTGSDENSLRVKEQTFQQCQFVVSAE
jgi:hypothetical protein